MDSEKKREEVGLSHQVWKQRRETDLLEKAKNLPQESEELAQVKKSYKELTGQEMEIT